MGSVQARSFYDIFSRLLPLLDISPPVVTLPVMNNRTSISAIFRFWLPLQTTWLMMAIEGPLLTAIIARLADPKLNLAAYGVAFALAIMVEAPVIMMMSASTALADSAENFRRLRNFTWILNVGITVVMVVLVFSPAWSLVIHQWMRLDPQVAALTHTSLIILLPWPAAIGYRRFYQGLLIRTGRTRRVAWGTGVRLVVMMLTAFGLKYFTTIGGAWIGASALTTGVLAEAVAARLMARDSIAEVMASPVKSTLSYGEITRFYYPLALTSTISLLVHPMVTFFLGQSRNSLESLAVMPVINALVFIFRTPGLSFQEAAITMLGRSKDNLPVVKLFAIYLGGAAALGLAMIALTPLNDVWFRNISGLSVDLAAFAKLPVIILVLMPAMSITLSMQRALLVSRRTTGPVTWASTLEVLGILITLAVTLNMGNWVGATAAATAFMVGRALGILWLWRSTSGFNPAQPPRS
jgi:progressive ankylosis protein